LIKSFILTIALTLSLQISAAVEVEKNVADNIKSSISQYSQLLSKSGVKIELERALYNKDKSKIKAATIWHTKAGEQAENVVLVRDEFDEYKGNFSSSKQDKLGLEITTRGHNVEFTDKNTEGKLKKAVDKYTKLFKKAKVGLIYDYSLYNSDKSKIKLVVKWQTSAGDNSETIILSGDEFGEFQGYFKASKKKQAQGKKGLPISITL